MVVDLRHEMIARFSEFSDRIDRIQIGHKDGCHAQDILGLSSRENPGQSTFGRQTSWLSDKFVSSAGLKQEILKEMHPHLAHFRSEANELFSLIDSNLSDMRAELLALTNRQNRMQFDIVVNCEQSGSQSPTSRGRSTKRSQSQGVNQKVSVWGYLLGSDEDDKRQAKQRADTFQLAVPHTQEKKVAAENILHIKTGDEEVQQYDRADVHALTGWANFEVDEQLKGTGI